MWLANEALRRVKGSDVALIAASEPLWAAVAAMALLGDVLPPAERHSIKEEGTRQWYPSPRCCNLMRSSEAAAYISKSYRQVEVQRLSRNVEEPCSLVLWSATSPSPASLIQLI